MRRNLPLCVLAILLAYLSGCGEAPSRPSVITDRPVNPPKTSARYIQVPWDISLFFNIPGGAIVSGAATAATLGGAAEGDNLTGTYTNSTGFGGTLSGVLTGNLESGTFNGTLKTITPSGCTAERQFSGPLTTETLNWSPGNHVNDCGGTSPLDGQIQVTAAPANAPPPCTYSSAASLTSFPAAGGSGTVTVTAGTGCTWFATSSASFVTLSAAQGTGNGSVQVTVAANTTTSARTATVVVAGQSFTITQAGVPAPVCTYALNDTGRTFDAAGALGGVDMRAPAGCAWTAVSDASWLTFTSGSAGTGDGAINFAVAANPGPGQRVGRITAQGQIFTVTQNGLSCVFTVTPSQTAFPEAGGSGTLAIATSASCGWTAVPNVPWITLPGSESGTRIIRGTGPATISFGVASNTGAARTGTITAAGQTITITQAAACAFTVTPSQTAFPEAGGTGTVAVATTEVCSWTAASNAPSMITLTGATSGTGNGTVPFAVARNTGAARGGTMTIAGQTVSITQAVATVGTLSGTITNSLNGGPVSGASVVVGNLTATTATNGTYSLSSVPLGSQTVRVSAAQFVSRSDSVVVGFQTTHSVPLTPATPVLAFAFNANPIFPNDADRHCGEAENLWCWTYTNVLQESGGATLTVTGWEINLYDPAGALFQHTVFTAADFARFYNGATGVPANGTTTGGATVWFGSSSGGTIELVISGVDTFNRPYRFVSVPRLSAQERAVGLRRAAPGGTSTTAPRPRPRGGR
jgi:hypothetical protein